MKLFIIWCGVNTAVLLWCVWAVRSLCDMLVRHSDIISDILDTIRMHQLNERMRNGDAGAMEEAEKLLKDEGYDKPEMDNDSQQA